MFTDTHCHIYKEYYSNINEIINNAFKNNITRFINNGCNLKTNIEVLDTIKNYDSMYGAIGIHPTELSDYLPEHLEFIKNNLNNPKIIAIGEIGLDYHYTKEFKDIELSIFNEQLKLAETYNLPVIIHSRDATLDTINTLKKYHVKGIIHSFSGSYETALIYIKMGFLLGINGVITFKNSNLKEVIKKIPLDYIVLETDSPYLTPEPFRGTTNEPARIIEIAKYICNLKNISLSELSKITNANIKRIFDI